MLSLFQTLPGQGVAGIKRDPLSCELGGSLVTEVKVSVQPVSSHSNQITTVVKIGSLFKLKFDVRKAFLGDVFPGVAQPAWMREADHPYTLVVTLLKKQRRFPPQYQSMPAQKSICFSH